MTAATYTPKHRAALQRRVTRARDYVPRHSRGTVYVVVTAWRPGLVSGYLLADTGEVLAVQYARNIEQLTVQVLIEAARCIGERYTEYDVIITPRDGEVPADVEQARREHMLALGGAS